MHLRLKNFLWVLLVSASLIIAQETNIQTLIRTVIACRADGKIAIPASIKHIKFDIGLSYSAPMAQHWLLHEDDLLVFGFEPNPACVASILQGATKRDEAHGDPLEKKFIGTQFFLMPCALGLAKNSSIKFFVTNDCGCSSIYFPKFFSIERIIEVPIFSLETFFDIFPFDTHPVIDYIKIDAQGSDLDIAKSAGHYLAERVIYITLEAEDRYYENTLNSYEAIEQYMQSIGFVPHSSPHTSDPTYFNPRFAEYIKTHNVRIYQKG